MRTPKKSCLRMRRRKSVLNEEDVIAAIAAKDAAAAPAAAAPIRENARPVAAQHGKKVNRTAKKRPELKEPVQPAAGGTVTHFRCKECDFNKLAPIFHKNWARHCHDHHKEENDDAGDKNDDGDDAEHDGADQTDDVQPKEAAEPKRRYGPKISEPTAAEPVRRQRDSALPGSRGTECKEA